MLTTQNSILAASLSAAVMSTSPMAPADLGAWMIDFSRPSVSRPDVAPKPRRVVSVGTEYNSQDWVFEKVESLQIQSTVLGAWSNLASSSNGYTVAWQVAPAILELQNFLSLAPNWDGEGARSPDIGTILSAMRFLQEEGIDATQWSATLHANGSAILESEINGSEVEMIFLPDHSVSVWQDGAAKAATVSQVLAAFAA